MLNRAHMYTKQYTWATSASTKYTILYTISNQYWFSWMTCIDNDSVNSGIAVNIIIIICMVKIAHTYTKQYAWANKPAQSKPYIYMVIRMRMRVTMKMMIRKGLELPVWVQDEVTSTPSSTHELISQHKDIYGNKDEDEDDNEDDDKEGLGSPVWVQDERWQVHQELISQHKVNHIW